MCLCLAISIHIYIYIYVYIYNFFNNIHTWIHWNYNQMSHSFGHDDPQAEWLSGWVAVAEWLVQPLWQSGWVAASISRAVLHIHSLKSALEPLFKPPCYPESLLQDNKAQSHSQAKTGCPAFRPLKHIRETTFESLWNQNRVIRNSVLWGKKTCYPESLLLRSNVGGYVRRFLDLWRTWRGQTRTCRTYT